MMEEYILNINPVEKTKTVEKIETAIHTLKLAGDDPDGQLILDVLEAIRIAINHKDRCIIPCDLQEDMVNALLPENAGTCGSVDTDMSVNYWARNITRTDGAILYPIFTDMEHLAMGQETSTITEEFEVFLERILMIPDCEGIVLNPWTEPFQLNKTFIKMIFEGNLPGERENLLCFSACELESSETGHIFYDIHETENLRDAYWEALEWARWNGIHSLTFPGITGNEPAVKEILTIVDAWLKINPHFGMALLFACPDKETESLYLQTWEEIEKAEEAYLPPEEANALLEKAIHFAAECHKGAKRKGTNLPYILHPMETLQILSAMDADTSLMIAGVLHDTLEDTNATLKDILEKFGLDVAVLVNAHTEDKRDIWYMRKLHTIDALPKEKIRAKMLAMADKTANLRSLYRDYKMVGEELWERFNAPKEMQAWYYSKIMDGLWEMQNYSNTEDIYWEMVGLYKDLFVSYFIDEEKGLLYQLCSDGDHVLRKGKPQWNPLEKPMTRKTRPLSRKDAERIEDNWAEPFWAVHEQDMQDGVYEIHKSDKWYFFIEIKNSNLMFQGDNGESSDLNVTYVLGSADDTHRFLTQLRLKYSTRNKLETMLKNEFGSDDGAMRFGDFCEKNGVEMEVIRF